MKVSTKRFSHYWYDVGLEKPNKVLSWTLLPNTNFHEIAVISDLHFGNLCQQKTMLNNFIELCKERSINTLLCAGDLTDGLMSYDGHEKERFLHSGYSYEEYLEDNYPYMDNNFIISGNHDNSISKYEDTNYDFCKELCKVRTDLKYHIARDDNLTKPFNLPGNIKLTMYHGSSCVNPIMKQRREPKLQQKTAELLSNNNSNIAIFGHCHRRCLTNFMNTYILGVGCFVSDTQYQINRGTFGDICGLILRYCIEKNNIICLEPEFISYEQLGGIKKNDF